MAAVVVQEFRKSATLMLRYPLGSAATIALLVLVFVGIHEVSRGFVVPEGGVPPNPSAVIQKFTVWSTMIIGLSSVAGFVKDDTRSGLIELLWMSPSGPLFIISVRALISSAVATLLSLMIAQSLSLIYSTGQLFDGRFVLALGNVAIASIGVGLLIGSATIVFKEIGPTVTAPRPEGRGFLLLRLRRARCPCYASLHRQRRTALPPSVPGCPAAGHSGQR